MILYNNTFRWHWYFGKLKLKCEQRLERAAKYPVVPYGVMHGVTESFGVKTLTKLLVLILFLSWGSQKNIKPQKTKFWQTSKTLRYVPIHLSANTNISKSKISIYIKLHGFISRMMLYKSLKKETYYT